MNIYFINNNAIHQMTGINIITVGFKIIRA